MMSEWFYYINDPFFFAPRLFYWLWNHLMCRRGVHLLDEVLSDESELYLWCSACDVSILVAEYCHRTEPGFCL